MDPISLILTIVGLVLSIGVAWWQHRRAVSAEQELQQVLGKMPERVAEQVQTVMAALPAPTSDNAEPVLGHEPFVVSYADVDGDGQKELLVQSIWGAHQTQLDVFTWKGGMFQPMGRLFTTTPHGFTVEDFDSDGRLEVATIDADYSTGHPYVTAPRVKIWYRWDGSQFVEVARVANHPGFTGTP